MWGVWWCMNEECELWNPDHCDRCRACGSHRDCDVGRTGYDGGCTCDPARLDEAEEADEPVPARS
jgi:hypothetical protein